MFMVWKTPQLSTYFIQSISKIQWLSKAPQNALPLSPSINHSDTHRQSAPQPLLGAFFVSTDSQLQPQHQKSWVTGEAIFCVSEALQGEAETAWLWLALGEDQSLSHLGQIWHHAPWLPFFLESFFNLLPSFWLTGRSSCPPIFPSSLAFLSPWGSLSPFPRAPLLLPLRLSVLKLLTPASQ